MKLKNNKGITGVDISISLVIIVLFVGIITSLLYSFVISSRNIDRKTMATEIAVDKLESMKLNYNVEEGTTVEQADINKDTGQVAYSNRAIFSYNYSYKIF